MLTARIHFSSIIINVKADNLGMRLEVLMELLLANMAIKTLQVSQNVSD
jgi:hypothetical protein